jgi:zinc/manganese transport system permease protein
VIRGQSFASHSLADVSSAGGAAAFLLGINPLLGFLGMGVLAAACMEMFRVDRATERDLVTGVVTGAELGLAALLLYLDVTTSNHTGAAVTVMFGSMFAIPASIVPFALAVGSERWSRSACSTGRRCSARWIRTSLPCAECLCG